MIPRSAHSDLRVLVISVSPILRAGIRHIIAGLFPRFEVFCSDFSFNTGSVGDIVIICFDISNQNESGKTIREVSDAFPDATLVTYDQTDSDGIFLNSMICNARGYISHKRSVDDLRSCIEMVLDGRKVYDNEKLIDLILSEKRIPDQEVSNSYKYLTRKEKQISELLVKGMRPLEIAKYLGKSISTVSTTKSNLFRKMGVENVVELSKALLYRPY